MVSHCKVKALCAWLAVLGWAAAIVTLSSLHGEDLAPVAALAWDKLLHALAFAVGSGLVAVALRLSTRLPWPRIVGWSIVAVAIFGATDEWHQLYTPARSGADVGDWIADCVGALLGAVSTPLAYVRTIARTSRPAH